MADQRPYRVYRGGSATRPRDDDPQLADPAAVGGERHGPVILPPAQPPTAAGPGGRRPRWRRIVVVCLLVVAVLAIGWLGAGYLAFRDSIARANSRLDGFGGASLRATLTPDSGMLVTSPTLILVLGYDKTGHSDSIQLMRFDPGRGLVATLSVPRDLRVAIPGYGTDKINQAVAVGGAPLAVRTVSAFVGLPINHVVIVDFTGFKSLVDALGGVDLLIRHPLISDFDGHTYKFFRGLRHLDGAQALAYARIRKNRLNPADSDVSRGQRQQQLMTAIRQKLATPGTLLKLQSVGDAIGNPLATDLSSTDLLSLGFVDFRANRHLTCNLGGTPTAIAGIDYLLPSFDNVRVIHEFLGDNAPLPVATGDPFAPACHVPAS